MTLPPATAKKKRPRPDVRIVGRSLRVGARSVPLLSGALHYFRLEPDAWRPALDELRSLGFPIVESYVPWGVHETAVGEYDFGSRDPRHDLARFLSTAHDAGLYVFLRPGPHINAEMTLFGLPQRIVYDRACQARSPRQNPVILPFPPQMFPVPSYASSRFLAETGRWFDAVAKVVVPHLYPRGPVVMLQVDNEAAFYFRNGAYDQDYHPDAVVAYRRFLERRHGDLATLERVHRRRYASWDEVVPPEAFDAVDGDGLPRHLDWTTFQEALLADSLIRMKRRMGRAGLRGVPIVHNLPLGEGGLPISISQLASSLDAVGLDYYHAAREHRTIKRRTLLLAGTVDVAFAPEMGAGAPPWFTPLSHRDSVFCALTALAYGLRGFNLYMAVDRDRWYGAPIDAQGTPRVEAAAWKQILRQLTAHRFHELERRVEVVLMVPHEYARLARVTHLLGPLSPSVLEAVGGTPVDAASEEALGFVGPIQVLFWRMLAKVSDALTRAGIPYTYVAGDAPIERYAGVKVVFTPSYEFVSEARWRTVASLARSGTRIVAGPAMPTYDDTLRPHPFEVPKDAKFVLLDTPDDADELIRALAAELDLATPFRVQPGTVETAVHEDTHGPRVLFVINPERTGVDAEIELPFGATLTDVLTDDVFEGEARVVIPVDGETCRMLHVERHALASTAKRPRIRRSGQ